MDAATYDEIVKIATDQKGFDSWTMLGMTDEAVEGKWVYQSTNKVVNFFKWIPGKPNNLNNNEHCASVKWDSGLMEDLPCSREQYFICEK